MNFEAVKQKLEGKILTLKNIRDKCPREKKKMKEGKNALHVAKNTKSQDSKSGAQIRKSTFKSKERKRKDSALLLTNNSADSGGYYLLLEIYRLCAFKCRVKNFYI